MTNINLNDYEEQESMYYNGEDKDLSVKIVKLVEFDIETEKPYALVTFKIITGVYKNKILSNRFYLHKKAIFKIRGLVIACNLGELKDDNSYHFPDEFDTNSLLNKVLKLDTYLNEKGYTEATNFQPVMAEKDPKEEMKDIVDAEVSPF